MNIICSCKGIRTCKVCEKDKEKIVENIKSSQSLLETKDITKHVILKEYKYRNNDEKEIIIKEAFLPVDYNNKSKEKSDLIINKEEVKYLSLGFFIINNIFNTKEIESILTELNSTNWVESQSGRKKQDFGVKINYKKRKIKSDYKSIIFPTYKNIIENKIKEIYDNTKIEVFNDYKIHEIGNLKYQPELGAHIVSHIDDAWVWGNRIFGVNLISDVKMTISKVEKLVEEEKKIVDKIEKDNTKKENDLFINYEIILPVKANEIYLMSDDSRHIWKHGIKAEHVQNERIVITCREFVKGILSSES